MSRRLGDLFAPLIALFSAACALLSWMTPGASAQDIESSERPQIVAARVGFAGQWRMGVWTPVEIELRGGSTLTEGRLELTTPDGEGVPARVVTPSETPLVIPPGETIRVDSYARFGNANGPLTVAFIEEEEPRLERVFSAGESSAGSEMAPGISANRELFVTVGPPIGVDEFAASASSHEGRRIAVAEIPDPSRLPARWWGYEGADTVVIMAADPATVADLTEERRQALLTWVELGGRLVVLVGQQADALLAPGKPLAAFTPGTFEGLVELPRGNALEAFARSSSLGIGTPGKGVMTPRFRDPKGIVEVNESGAALVTRTPRGFGEIIFIGLDMHAPPFVGWDGRRRFFARLLGEGTRRETANEPAKSSAVASEGASYGVSDLSGQLRAALDRFEGVEPISFGVIAGMLIGYILLIGPLEFLLLKFVVRRMEWTWFVFPLTVAILVGLVYFGALRAKGDSPILNQVDVVDLDASTGLVRGASWFRIYSPSAGSREISVQVAQEGNLASPIEGERETLLAWMGLPGAGLGGMESQAAPLSLFGQAYESSPDSGRVSHLPTPIWSSRGFVARWRYQAQPIVESRLTASADELAEGKLVNRSKVVFRDCMLASGASAYTRETWSPGETWTVRGGEQRELASVLKDAKLVQDKKSLVRVTSRYNPAGLDVPTIVRQMSFDEAAGGEDYTGLAHAYQEFIDVSPQLRLGRAIFSAAVDDVPTPLEVQLDGRSTRGAADRHWVFLRVVLPVEPANSPRAEPRDRP